MRFALLLVLLLSTSAMSQQQIGDGQGRSRIINNTQWHMVCIIQLSNGREIFWELYPGQATPWWYINNWRCQ